MPASGAEAHWRPGQGPNKYEGPLAVNHYFPFFSSLGHKSTNRLNSRDSFQSQRMEQERKPVKNKPRMPPDEALCAPKQHDPSEMDSLGNLGSLSDVRQARKSPIRP